MATIRFMAIYRFFFPFQPGTHIRYCESFYSPLSFFPHVLLFSSLISDRSGQRYVKSDHGGLST